MPTEIYELEQMVNLSRRGKQKKRCLGQCKSLDLCPDFMEGDVEAGLIIVSHISQKNPRFFVGISDWCYEFIKR